MGKGPNSLKLRQKNKIISYTEDTVQNKTKHISKTGQKEKYW